MDCMTARATGIAGGLEPELAAATECSSHYGRSLMVRTMLEKNSRRPVAVLA
jgi:hypothetical protein